jgi:hypothetical protein
MALTNAHERGRLRDRVRREVVKLHAVVVAERPHETTRRRREASLVEADEANHIATRRVGRVVPGWRHDPLGRPAILVRRQLAGGHQLVQGQPRHRRALPRVRIDDDERRLRRHEGRQRGEGRRTGRRRRAPKAERCCGRSGSGAAAQGETMANAKVKNRRFPTRRIYRPRACSPERAPRAH